MADVYGFSESQIQQPLTADKAILQWGGVIAGAVQFSLNYNQQVNRRRTIGNRGAVIWASLPSGQIQIGRMLTTDAAQLFSAPGWKACNPGTITITLGGGCDGQSGPTFTAKGCVVTTFSLQLEAEGLTVMDNVGIEFLHLSEG